MSKEGGIKGGRRKIQGLAVGEKGGQIQRIRVQW